MRVLHIPEGGLPVITLSRALRLKGITSSVCHFYENRYNFESDVCLHLQNIPKHLREKEIKKYLDKAIHEYDIFHFHFGGTFFSDKRDLERLKRAGKKMVVHHHGSDVRMLSVAKERNPYVRVKPEWTEGKIKKSLSKLSAYVDHAIVQDEELKTYVKDYYNHTHVIPHIVDHNELQPNYPPFKSTPLVLHAPTKRDLKGTEFVLSAVEKLKKEGISFDFRLIEGMDHQETMNLLSKADIVIDQLRIGASGYLSTEAMALGKPVICYIREDLVDAYPKDFPIVNAHPNTIKSVLKKLIQNPAQWKELGVKGRAYIKHHHIAAEVIDDYIDIYKQL
ncbi:glycosyltransferase [Virgibacillus alimentarius]|uniref:glycosyltransferase n=1 Tax=Virgibacillus alimentarius TaxID=698769 RepID=UPI00049331F8|nr:glycosyltransferase [Virgibacillus alimentarius]